MPQIVNRRKRRETGGSERPHLFRVFLIDDGTVPPEFELTVLMSVFRMSNGQASHLTAIAAQSGTCVVGVFTQEVAEMKAVQAIRLGGAYGFPMSFATQREE